MAKETIRDLREQLGAYLTKPLPIDSGKISTQQSLSATSLTNGGLTSEIKITQRGYIQITDKILIGYQKNGF